MDKMLVYDLFEFKGGAAEKWTKEQKHPLGTRRINKYGLSETYGKFMKKDRGAE